MEMVKGKLYREKTGLTEAALQPERCLCDDRRDAEASPRTYAAEAHEGCVTRALVSHHYSLSDYKELSVFVDSSAPFGQKQ